MISSEAIAVVGGATGLAGGGATVGEVDAAIAAAIAALTIPDEIADLDDFSGTPSTGDLLQWDGTDWVPYTPEAIDVPVGFSYTIDGGGIAVTTGLKYGFKVYNAGTITGWDLGADQNTTSSVQVWKDTTANFPPVVGDLILTMSTVAGTKYGSATGLSIAFSAGDWFYFNVSANNSATVLLPNIAYTREVGP
jgi:hypothetical protein